MVVANDNHPEQVVIAGPTAAVDDAVGPAQGPRGLRQADPGGLCLPQPGGGGGGRPARPLPGRRRAATPAVPVYANTHRLALPRRPPTAPASSSPARWPRVCGSPTRSGPCTTRACGCSSRSAPGGCSPAWSSARCRASPTWRWPPTGPAGTACTALLHAVGPAGGRRRARRPRRPASRARQRPPRLDGGPQAGDVGRRRPPRPPDPRRPDRRRRRPGALETPHVPMGAPALRCGRRAPARPSATEPTTRWS